MEQFFLFHLAVNVEQFVMFLYHQFSECRVSQLPPITSVSFKSTLALDSFFHAFFKTFQSFIPN
jgi:transglutaminase/protease-like cytokinesis protein 3